MILVESRKYNDAKVPYNENIVSENNCKNHNI